MRRLNKGEHHLMDRAARARGEGGGLVVRDSTRKPIGGLLIAGMLRTISVWDEPSQRAMTVLVPTEAGDAALAAARNRVTP